MTWQPGWMAQHLEYIVERQNPDPNQMPNRVVRGSVSEETDNEDRGWFKLQTSAWGPGNYQIYFAGCSPGLGCWPETNMAYFHIP